jgi:hypothetical protein
MLDDIKAFIADDKVAASIARLREVLEADQATDALNELTLLESRYHNLQRNRRLGVIGYEDNLELNRIKLGLIELIDACRPAPNNAKRNPLAQLFTQYIAPSHEQFLLLHDSYLLSLQQYHQLIADSKHPITEQSELFNRIGQEMILSVRDRIDIALLLEQLVAFKADFAPVGEYGTALLSYLQLSDSLDVSLLDRPINIARQRVFDNLKDIIANDEIPAEEVNAYCLREIDQMAELLHAKYVEVERAFQRLRRLVSELA